MAVEEVSNKDAEEYGRPVVWTVGFTLLAIPMIISAIMYIAAFAHDGNVLWDEGYLGMAVAVCYKVVGVMLIVVAAYGFAKKVYAESLFLAINAAFLIIVGICSSEFEMGNEAMMTIDIMLGVFLLVPIAVFAMKKQILLSVAGILYVIANIGCELFNSPTDCAVYGFAAIIAGVIFAYVALACLVKKETGRELPYV